MAEYIVDMVVSGVRDAGGDKILVTFRSQHDNGTKDFTFDKEDSTDFPFGAKFRMVIKQR